MIRLILRSNTYTKLNWYERKEVNNGFWGSVCEITASLTAEVGLCHNSVVSANSMSCNGPPRIFENVLIIKTKKHGGPELGKLTCAHVADLRHRRAGR
ncbi:hypothetical protein WN943_013059 [Citrus x changshan-huyou]